MLSDFHLIQHEFDQDIVIYPISDVHLGSLEHDGKTWDKFCESLIERPNAYITLGGDLINNATRSSVSNIFKDVLSPSQQKRRMKEALKPIKSRILCAVSGNHERRSQKDADYEPMYDIMGDLEIEHLYRENIAFMKLSLGKRTNETKAKSSFMFAITHGAGGGIYTGASVNRNERFGNVIDGVDCLIVGHTHKGTVSKPGKIVVDPRNNQVYRRDYTVITSVPWQAYGGYAMQKMLLPAANSCPQEVHLSMGKVKQLEVRW